MDDRESGVVYGGSLVQLGWGIRDLIIWLAERLTGMATGLVRGVTV
jgi:hypothetical protein